MIKHDIRSLALFLLAVAAYCVVSTMDYNSEVERQAQESASGRSR